MASPQLKPHLNYVLQECATDSEELIYPLRAPSTCSAPPDLLMTSDREPIGMRSPQSTPKNVKITTKTKLLDETPTEKMCLEKPARKQGTSHQWLNQQKENDDLNRIVLTIKNGNLDGMQQELMRRYGSGTKINYDEYLKDGWTLMLHAVSNLQYDIVTYLINKGANVNCESGSLTPLMLICSLDISQNEALSMAKLLLDQGALVNARDGRGFTPFMYACTRGNKDIVNLLLNFAAIDVSDNFSKTALHYAVENRHFDIVQTLLNAGADIEICSTDGLKPRDLAISLDLADIEALFPVEIVDYLPTSADQYETFQDIAPAIFPGREMAAYSQDIPRMLRGMRMENCAKLIHEANISLAEFLTIDDAGLQSLGIEFEYQRKRILLGLLKFHGHAFSPKSIELVSKKKQRNLYEYFGMYAGYLKHLVIMESSLVYLNKIGALKSVPKRNMDEALELINNIRTEVLSLQKCIQQASIHSTINPLFIGSATHQSQKYKNVVRPFVKYSVMIGLGIFLSCKLVRLVR